MTSRHLEPLSVFGLAHQVFLLLLSFYLLPPASSLLLFP